MSYLLEALRKSQAEREQKVPGLHTPAPEWSDDEPAPERSRWLVVIAAGLLTIVVLLAVLIWRLGNPVQPVLPDPGDAGSAVVQTPLQATAAPSPAAQVNVRTQPALTLHTGRQADPEAPILPAASTTKAAPESAVARRPVSQARSETAATDANEPLQRVYELAEALQLRLPPMKMNSHIYSTDPASSFVMINDMALNPGQELTAGVILVTITPDGAVLRFEGQKFLLPAMGSFEPPF